MIPVRHHLNRLFIVAVLIGSAPGCPAPSTTSTPDTGPMTAVPAETPNAAPTEAAASEAAVADPSNSEAAAVGDADTFRFVAPKLTEQELRDGWISLFDGSTLFGWNVPDNANWHVEDGTIVADSGEISLLRTPFVFDNFEFRCDFHLAAGGNSGVFLRTAEVCENPAADTYELNICDTHKEFKTGSLVGRHVAADVPAVEAEWHTFHVTCDKATIRVAMDGKQIVDFTDDSEHQRSSGYIGLQMNQGRIAFRNVFLKPLDGQELFNGQDLTGFHDVPGTKSTFEVIDGVIHAEGGPGFLETEQTWDNFVLHVEANIHDEKAIADGRPANSGVFFRSIRGTQDAPSHGYEMQIQHDFKDGDRSQPLDFGSGAIYRRQAARYIVADNNQWFVETLIAQGNRFATFVNGYQVLDWIDDRDPDPNPRKGQRLEAGHLSLQGHDPTTNLDFRSLRVHKLP
ncbi:MAG: DUF1080 domain-containing protein [Planctomycetaceae bacterium]